MIFDVRLAHGIRRPAGPCCRLLWGGHFQGRHNLAPHREDQDHSEIAELRRFAEFPTLFAPRGLPPSPAPAAAKSAPSASAKAVDCCVGAVEAAGGFASPEPSEVVSVLVGY